jgi:acyl dehydratase
MTHNTDESVALPSAVQSLIGKPLYREVSDVLVEQGAIENFCAAVENGNPLYWDEGYAQEFAGGRTAPASMLSAWFRPHIWKPGADGEQHALQAHFDLKELLALPEAVIASNELSFGQPAKVGERLQSYQCIRSISEPKTTKLGHGRFWVVDVVVENADGEFIGSDSYTAFGYRRPAQ